VDVESERETLMATSREWARVAARGDIEATLSFWADNAIVMAPGQPTIVGKDAIRDFLRRSSAIPGFSITWEPEYASIAKALDVGYMVERNRVTVTDATGTLRTQFGKAVTVWRRTQEGGWKCVVDTWNDSPAEGALPPGLTRLL
jgi:ketosteroid isomerase-like protein